ncbi:Crp/Fnr family transcriptional regulator [Streptomyces sp. F63]|uniref:Crp/Fnr family transcriptional regulator n=1 Tax=Streptomyces sp. F63 TaxID=2824887 RepID=UPI001B3978B6|nr:Crp/Fnr family transcriptional regulator [Streptomyces sp. F63]MBQ0985740.1 Crp/Fnr family transcriptional regulator [Streptomyces sp. F63]
MGLFEQGRSFLDALPAPDRTALVRLGTARRYAPGEVLMRERDRTSFVVAILRGWATVSVDTERGGRLILAVRGAGSVVGDLAAVDRGPRSATITALGPLDTLVIPGDRFRGFLASHPAANGPIMRQLSSRLRSSDGERRALASENVLRRLAARIVELSDRAGASAEGGGVAIALPMPQHDLAAAIGTTREAVAKALRLLREQGVVSTAHRRLVVENPALLRLLARGESTREGGDAG